MGLSFPCLWTSTSLTLGLRHCCREVHEASYHFTRILHCALFYFIFSRCKFKLVMTSGQHIHAVPLTNHTVKCNLNFKHSKHTICTTHCNKVVYFYFHTELTYCQGCYSSQKLWERSDGGYLLFFYGNKNYIETSSFCINVLIYLLTFGSFEDSQIFPFGLKFST